MNKMEANIKQKIEKYGTPLKEWNINIYRGILTGYNEAFIIDEEKRRELVIKDPKNNEIIKPILRRRDIKRYYCEWKDLYVIKTFPALKLDIDDYPVIKEHLLSFGYDRLKQTGEQGSRRKANNEWFETGDKTAYHTELKKEKIIFPDICQEPQFYLDNTGKYIPLDTNYFIVGNNLKYIFALLNSNLITFAYKNFYAGGGLGETGYRYKKQFMELLPVPLPTPELESQLTKLVDDILKLKADGKRTNTLESQIDDIVYEMYGLSDEEIRYICK